MLILLIVLLLVFGGYGMSPLNSYGAAGWSPLGVIILLIAIYVIFGGVRWR